MMQDLEIGQVVYILSEKSGNVIPAIVAEESHIKTLEGNTISWKLHVGPESNRKIIDSKQVNGEVYSSIEEITSILHARLTDFLNGTITDTKARAHKWYGKYYSNDLTDDSNGSSTDDSGRIDPDKLLESVDRESTSSKPMVQRVAQVATNKKQKTQKSSLKEMIMPSPEELMNNIITDEQGSKHQTGPSMKKLRMPDGTYVDIAVEQNEQGLSILE